MVAIQILRDVEESASHSKTELEGFALPEGFLPELM